MKKRAIWIVNKWALTALIFVLACYGFAERRPDPGKDSIDEQTLRKGSVPLYSNMGLNDGAISGIIRAQCQGNQEWNTGARCIM